MNTSIGQSGSATPETPRRATGGRHLKLVQYRPAGDESVVCAAIWREDGHVHLASPLLPTRHRLRDLQAYARRFPDGMASIHAFEDTMAWLDAACYAAADPREVESACEEHPEWRLRCVRFDGNDASLCGLSGLIRAADKAGPVPQAVLRDCLLELIRQILRNDPELVDAQIDAGVHDRNDVAMLEIGKNRAVLVTLLTGVASTDAVRQGLLANQRMKDQFESPVNCLLVMPDLQIDRPMFTTARVAITNMQADHVRAALAQMARR